MGQPIAVLETLGVGFVKLLLLGAVGVWIAARVIAGVLLPGPNGEKRGADGSADSSGGHSWGWGGDGDADGGGGSDGGGGD